MTKEMRPSGKAGGPFFVSSYRPAHGRQRGALSSMSDERCFCSWGNEPKSAGLQRRLVSAIDVAHKSCNGFDIVHGCLRLGRIAAMLPSVVVTLGGPLVRAAVHSATPLAVHRRRLAFRPLAGPGEAARRFGQPIRLHRIVCPKAHFYQSPRDDEIDRQ